MVKQPINNSRQSEDDYEEKCEVVVALLGIVGMLIMLIMLIGGAIYCWM